MSRQRSGRAPDLDGRLDALGRALELARGRCDADLLRPGAQVIAQAGERRRLAPGSTVVALAGGTGSGKSTLFNALTGADLAPTGVRRPTTSRARAACWPASDDPGPLLDWLDVRDRHQVADDGPGGTTDGLVLIDLPDFDSTAAAHRLEAERLTGVVDLLVWVLDPQKYADAAVHERYLRPLATHRDVMLVVLNQVDRLPPDAVRDCRRHLDQLLAADGLWGVPTVGVSATRGDGLPELRGMLTERVQERAAADQRLHDDLDRAVAVLGPLDGSPGGGQRTAQPTGRVAARADDELVRALGVAAGVDALTAAAAGSYRLRARAAVGWAPTRWVARVRVDPLRRLRRAAPGGAARARAAAAARAATGRASPASTASPADRPPSTGVHQAQVSNAVRDVVTERMQGLPTPWQRAAAERVGSQQAAITGELDRAVHSADLSPPVDPAWWRALRLVQRVLLAVAVVGALWLAGLAALSYLRVPDLTLHAGRLPVPTVLLVGGLVIGLLLALTARPFVAAGGRRRAAQARRSLEQHVRSVAQRCVLEPLDAELQAAGEFATALRAARR